MINLTNEENLNQLIVFQNFNEDLNNYTIKELYLYYEYNLLNLIYNLPHLLAYFSHSVWSFLQYPKSN